jgi:hypothetical protein
MPLFRVRFDCPKPVRHAVLSISGLGQYRCVVNGKDLAVGALDPAWTDYRSSVPYDTLDVTNALQPGQNVLGVRLGNGFFNVEGVKGRYTKLIGSYGPPKLIARLRIVHHDGSEKVISSDPEWETRLGPIVYSSIYGGEDFDARREVRDWFADAADWQSVKVVGGPGGTLRCVGTPPCGSPARMPPSRSKSRCRANSSSISG